MKRAWSVLVALAASLVLAGVLAPAVAPAQTPPPSAPPDLGLPPVDTRPPAAATRQGSNSDGSFGTSFVNTFTRPGGVVGALILALGVLLSLGGIGITMARFYA